MEKISRTSTVLNRLSTKRYALAVSETRRAGKFERVGESFLLSCEAKLEAAIRGLAGSESEAPSVVPGTTFITRTARDKAEEKLEILARKIIFSSVMAHPSLGKTLK